MLVKNLEAAKRLVKHYRAIKLKDIQDNMPYSNFTDMEVVLNEITGFGSINSCCLCQVIDTNNSREDCPGCIHNLGGQKKDRYPCTAHPSYDNIVYSKCPEELLIAIQERADYLEKLIKIAEW